MPVTLRHPDTFVRRHIGPGPEDRKKMLAVLGVSSLDQLVDQTVPKSIRLGRALDIEAGIGEHELLALARELGGQNELYRSYIGMGYSDCITPPVILRNVLENPGWYTQYTPYQAEIAQGRLEALLNFQTMVSDLTGLPIANASLLDEATAAAEAMHVALGAKAEGAADVFFVAADCHPQTIEVVRTRSEALGVTVTVGDPETADFAAMKPFGVLVQYPGTWGDVRDVRAIGDKAHAVGALFVVAADILSLALLVPPGELGADVAVGSTQRFGVPMGYGGPHAAYFACKEDQIRRLPGRIIGLSEDAQKRPALRMALQTREQHIRRERATSNICTAQALLAVIAGMYAVYHGPQGVRGIAEHVHGAACVLALGLQKAGVKVTTKAFFDTVRVEGTTAQIDGWVKAAAARRMNLRREGDAIGISVDETTSARDLAALLEVFGAKTPVAELAQAADSTIPTSLRRTSAYLGHAIFNTHHSETEMLRYLRKLERRDLSLCHTMIPLGSCTMKLNATAEMMPVTMPSWGGLHPFAPREQAKGYARVFKDLEKALAEVTGFPGISLQPNAGAQGEYAGLLVIRKYQETRGQGHRKVCLIPQSAHGTNPASAVMAGLDVVVVATDKDGNIDVADLEAKAKQHSANLAALMLTYPSTHGVFEEEVKRVCAIVHEHGGQVYMDGANMNAQVGLCRPGDIGADVCHLNLHKTFCIPHGGGGPGMGPIGVAAHLVKHLPRLPVLGDGGETAVGAVSAAPDSAVGAVSAAPDSAVGAVSAAPWGSASILLISWAYIKMMGGEGLKSATEHAILNANYIAARLAPHYPIVYKGKDGRIAHECILDMRGFKKTAGVEVDDIAKRLQDYGFHAPTMSFPIPGTLMIEPTESEPLPELDRFCDAMIAIRGEIRAIEEGTMAKDDNPLKNAPHTIRAAIEGEWTHPYSREVALFPAPWTKDTKFFSHVGRLNNAHGDRNLVCACPPMEDYLQR